MATALTNVMNTIKDNIATYQLSYEERKELAEGIIANLCISKGDEYPDWN